MGMTDENLVLEKSACMFHEMPDLVYLKIRGRDVDKQGKGK